MMVRGAWFSAWKMGIMMLRILALMVSVRRRAMESNLFFFFFLIFSLQGIFKILFVWGLVANEIF